MYRILIENKNVPELKILLVNMGLDYTMSYADGSWMGQPENSLIMNSPMLPKMLPRQLRY